ncbi:MAG: hypothetical protein HQM00_06245 [Magnetococcales bacterium]|jgi:hypothetical protein|nr:hypothetical protein [Magnetococcales bacterium]
MSDRMNANAALNLTPEAVRKLEKLKKELTFLQSAIQDLNGKSPHEVEGRIRQYQDKEAEIKRLLRDIGIG